MRLLDVVASFVISSTLQVALLAWLFGSSWGGKRRVLSCSISTNVLSPEGKICSLPCTFSNNYTIHQHYVYVQHKQPTTQTNHTTTDNYSTKKIKIVTFFNYSTCCINFALILLHPTSVSEISFSQLFSFPFLSAAIYFVHVLLPILSVVRPPKS